MLEALFASLTGCGQPVPGCCKVRNAYYNNSDVFVLHPLSNAFGPEAQKATLNGVHLLHDGRIEEALKELHVAQESARHSPGACCNLGCVYHMLERDESAIMWYREALRLAPNDALVARALCELNWYAAEDNGRKAEEVAGLRDLFILHPLKGANNAAQSATERGARLLRKGDTQAGIEELMLAQQAARCSFQACSNLGAAYHMMDEDSSAVTWYREALFLAPREETVVLPLAVLLQKTGSVDDARYLLTKFLKEVDESHTGALKLLAKLHENCKDWSQAARILQKLIEEEPSNTEWQKRLRSCCDQLPLNSPANKATAMQIEEAATLRERGHCAEALKVYDRVRQSDIHSTEALLGIAECQAEMGNSTAALAAVKKLLNSRPEHTEANLKAAELILASGQSVDLAEPFLKRAAKDFRGEQGAQLRMLCAMAEISLAREDYKQGMKHAAAAVRIDTASLRALLLLGIVHMTIAKYDSAIHTLQTAVEAPSTPRVSRAAARRAKANAHALLASAHERKGEYQLAMHHVSKALELEPQSNKARIARAMARYWSGQVSEATCELTDVLKQNPRHTGARLHLGYIQLSLMDPQAVSTLEGLNNSMPVAGSTLGASKVYLALALDLLADNANGTCRPERVLKEALALHRNLQHLWKEVESGATEHPAQAVQLMRSICDLDLTTFQARALLHLLARTAQRRDLMRVFETCERSHDSPSKFRLPSPRPQRFSPAFGDPADMAAALLPPTLAALSPQKGPGSVSQSPRVSGSTSCGQSITLGSVSSDRVPPATFFTPQSLNFGSSFSMLRNNSGLGTPVNSGNHGSATPTTGWGTPRGTPRGTPTGSTRSDVWNPPRQSTGRVTPPASGASTPRTPSTSPAGRLKAASFHFGTHMGTVPLDVRSLTPVSSFGALPMQTAPVLLPPRRATSVSAAGRGIPSNSSESGSVIRSHSAPRVTIPRVVPPAGEKVLELSCSEIIQPEHLIFGSMIGSGGSAQVFKGRWKNEEVAIKKISGSKHIEEMAKEINALRKLRHPNLVRFIGACLQPPLLLIVTEFMAGKSLHERIFHAKLEADRLTPLHRSRISTQPVQGLQFLHSHRIVHRDLKSMNILLDDEGSAKICDFGLAQQMIVEATHISRKLEGEGGSPRYMAPEILAPENGRITEKVDIWAYGCTLIELFTSVLPYADCMTMAQIYAKILVQKQPPEISASVAPALAAVIRGCHDFDESRRPSAADLMKQLLDTVHLSH